VNNFDLSPANKDYIFSFNFTGYVDVPSDGQYTFYTNSDDGSKLYIDDVLVVNNDGTHGAQEESGTIGLKAGKHAISVGFFQQTGDKILTVSYSGSNISKQTIPASLLFRSSTASLSRNMNLDSRTISIATTQITPDSINRAELLNTSPEIRAYPNPFVNSINVTIRGNAGNYKLVLVDVSGKVLWTKTGKKNAGSYRESLNTSALQRGVYFLKIIQGNKSSVFKLEK
jgi:hypothetical protein